MKDGRSITDFHAHILPGVDHGCTSGRVCEKQIQLAQKYGVSTIVATSHFYAHIHTADRFVGIRNKAFDGIRDMADKYEVKVIKASEVQLCIGLDRMPGIDDLRVENTNVMLVEIPDMPMCSEMYDTLRRLNKKYDVIVAHADRYTKSVIDNILDEGYKIQINIDSMFSFRKRKTLKRLINSDLVWAVGSDIHGPDKVPYEMMKKASVRFKEQFDVINMRMEKLLGR